MVALTIKDFEKRLKKIRDKQNELNSKDYWSEDDYAKNQYLQHVIKRYKKEMTKED